MPRAGFHPRSRKGAPRAPLSRERIEAAAIGLIERESYENFSIRKLAAELRCEAMSIYHYFPSRQHIMDALVDRMLAEVAIPTDELTPLEQIRELAISYRRMALRYPEFQRHFAFHRLNTPGGIRWIAGVLAVVARLGGGTEVTARLFRAFGYYITGAALDETSGYARGQSAAEPVPDDVVARDFPAVAAVNPFFQKDQHEKTFLLGLDFMLDGAARLTGPAPRKRGSGRRKFRS
ncbi:MAG TPA: TetR/AcrR family transcriptional regulator [Bauldia sp.]|nr:TetR/AcrR family transcriptional regulator [Bauldia sp.]